MDVLIQALIDTATTLITSITSLVTTTQTTHQYLINLQTPQVQTHITATLPSFKPEAPAVYQGDPNHVTAFIQELEIYFTLAGITAIEQKVFYTLSKICGGKGDNATAWSDSVRSNILERQRQIEHEEAIESIKILEQGNMTCEEYLTVFRVDFYRSGYNPIAGLQEFKRGLNKGLRNRLETTFPLPENNEDGTININNWINRASELNRQYRKAQRFAQGSKGSQDTDRQRTNPPRTYGNTYTAPPRNATPAPAPKDPNAMDIDRNRRSGIRNITCYHCQKSGPIGTPDGHYTRDCPDINKPKVFPPRGTRI
ncbi:hypothetical protein GALMADRAFT_212803 [Galerina marginata CBS 339.88]|uniref:Retrotransposon gag domain-containing protein n=1 Tax=Galerina marginata (strain CBS 339.88) TaxID=685588 RepID=A0A067SYJ0_GALM3|nr:hypothetical protein GALMADRAFT_212803 [Galerina marginata CBS 339.88]